MLALAPLRDEMDKRITSGKVAKQMHSNGLGRDYSPASLRTVVYRALDLIERMESTQRRDGSGPLWPPFEAAFVGRDGTTVEGRSR
jgi:hypothetical protein